MPSTDKEFLKLLSYRLVDVDLYSENGPIIKRLDAIVGSVDPKKLTMPEDTHQLKIEALQRQWLRVNDELAKAEKALKIALERN